MTMLAVALIVGGLAAVAWGLPAAHRLGKPWDILASIIVLAGLASALVGALLAVVPGFFG